jgi:hypothetical protein
VPAGLAIVTFLLANRISSVIVNYNTSSLSGRGVAGVGKMKEKLGQYVNDFVSLSVIVLMAIALIAGQTSAKTPERSQVLMDVSAEIDTSAQALMLHIDTVLDEALVSLPVGVVVAYKLKLRK